MSKKGLSLVEIIVASMILAIVMTGLAGIFVGGKRWILHFRSRMTAGELSRKFLDFIPLQVRQDQWGANELSNAMIADRSANTTEGFDRNYTANYTVVPGINPDSPVTNLTKVKVDIKWREPSP